MMYGSPQNVPIQNDAVSQVEAAIQRSGGDARAAFYAMAKEKGEDPDAFLTKLQSMGDVNAMAKRLIASNPRVQRLMSLFSLLK